MFKSHDDYLTYIRKYNKEYRAIHKERLNAYSRQYRKDNKEKLHEYYRNLRKMKNGVEINPEAKELRNKIIKERQLFMKKKTL